jgi:predicted amidophosphoribosyltransferase
MNECPYCYTKVSPTDVTCPNCGREIEHWQTGFYARQPLPARSRTAVWAGALLAFLLILAGFAKACHWV